MRKETVIVKTNKKEFDEFYPLIHSFLQKAKMKVVIDGESITGYRTPDANSIWIRDFSDMMRAVKYFETDLKTTVQHFADTQAKSGRIFDYFTVFPEKLPCEKENWTKYVRVPVEADVEYRFVKAVFLAWQSTGDDLWLERIYPCMEKALSYVIHHPWKWDQKHHLVKRPYTIDTWDFAYTAGAHDWLQFQINDQSFWGFMHGDNSGYYQAFKIMTFINDYFGNEDQKKKWKKRSQQIKKSMNEICWNGKFYTHFIKLTPVEINGVNEKKQLSLSNPMNINRGAAGHQKSVSIIKEYQKRWQNTHAFAEWFSIDPPFPGGIFGDEKIRAGAYVNGGIMPLVGGELSKAALEHGFEEYGVDILIRYFDMVSSTGETYLWYFPDGSPPTPEKSTSPEASSSDAWGSSAMLYAFIEGLCGIKDRSKRFEKVQISPRWNAAGVEKAEVCVGYAASEKFVRYTFVQRNKDILLDVSCAADEIYFHVLLPEKLMVKWVKTDGKYLDFKESAVEKSHYVDFKIDKKGIFSVNIELTGNK